LLRFGLIKPIMDNINNRKKGLNKWA
jgi:hypothetical protein